MSLSSYIYRLKAQAGQANPVDEKGGATLTGATQTLVDRGSGDMAWQFAAGISTAALPSKTTAPLTPGGGVTVARKIRIKNYGNLDFMVLMGLGSAAVGAGDTFPGNGLVLNKTASGFVQSSQKDSTYTPQFGLAVDTEIVIVTRYTAAQAGYIVIENWFTGGSGTAGANTSDGKSAQNNVTAQTFNTLSINASSGAIYQISDFAIWWEELTDAQCRAIATDMRAALAPAAPNLTSPTGTATGNTTGSASVSTDDATGTGYCLTQLSATTAPDAATVIASGTSKAITAVGVQTFPSRTGLTADSLYKNYFVQVGAAATSTVVASAAFRTTGAVAFSGTVPTRNGSVGTAASFTNAGFFASAFTLAYTLQAGSLPAGLTLSSSTGIISGTPTATGTSSGIVIRATDTNGNVADTNAYAIAVASSNVAPTFPGSIINISGTVGSAITPVNVSGQFSDTDALAYSASPAGTAWPSGMSINASTGVITGTPTAAATTTGCKVRATDTGSLTADSNAFNFVLAAPALRTWASPTKLVNPGPTPRAGVAITAFINAMDGTLLGAPKTGLTTGSDGSIPSFTTTQGSLATNYRVTYSEDADPTNAVAVEVLAPT